MLKTREMGQILVDQRDLALMLEDISVGNFPEFIFPGGFYNHNETMTRAWKSIVEIELDFITFLSFSLKCI